MNKLWDFLNIDSNFNYVDIDNIYRNIKNKNNDNYLAWKILRDRFYSEIYKKYQDIDLVYKAGFFDDKLNIDEVDFYNLNLLTTPFGKILDNINENTKNPIVLLSTGGFCPLHDGHIYMMSAAKKELEKIGYNVVGGYFSLSHDDYVLQKPFVDKTYEYRLDYNQRKVNDSNWLMIDSFECRYIKTYVNFTEIINRLELYLQKNVHSDIKVAYVFGADNANFMYCFENDGLGVCVNRKDSKEFDIVSKKLFNNNTIYIEENYFSNISSRTIRRKDNIYNNTQNNNKRYIIRNEGILPFSNLLNIVDKNTLCDIRQKTLLKIKQMFEEEFGDKNIEIIDMNVQLNKAQEELKNKKTISLDSYYDGTYNLQISRLFDISDKQIGYKNIIGRNNIDIKNQISNIPAGNYVLVDDDSVSGRTIKSVINCLPENIKIDSMYFLANQDNKVFDVVDFRDFIIGGNNNGLMVRLENNKNIRVPYALPYVSLSTRASVSIKNELSFSIKIWELNYFFYKSLGKEIKIKDLSVDTQLLMCYNGFNDAANILDAIEWHINILKNMQKKC